MSSRRIVDIIYLALKRIPEVELHSSTWKCKRAVAFRFFAIVVFHTKRKHKSYSLFVVTFSLLQMVPQPPSPAKQSAIDKCKRQLSDDAPELKPLLRSLNEAQSLTSNLRNLKDLGGVTTLAKRLGIDLNSGVDTLTLGLRRELFGCNSMPSAPRKSFWTLFCDTFDDGTLQILIVAAVVSLVIGIYDDPTTGYVEGCAILCAVLIVSVVTAINDYQKESQFRELSAANDEVDVVVVRNNTHWQVPVDQVVVGDLVMVEAGDEIPCDGVVVTSNQLQVDESALTGEPLDIDKNEADDPFLLSGCTVEAGSAVMLAMAVGKESQWGAIKAHLDKEQDQTPLQEKLDDMAAMIGYIGMGAAAATFVAMMAMKLVVKPEYLAETSVFEYALEAFIIGVTIVVVAVPEGLPLAVTIALAFSTKKMLADQNLIRHLQACETMGNATNICSDKTGTLTENRMTVVRGVFADMHVDDTINRVPVMLSKTALEYILECIACCSTARVMPSKTDQSDESDAVVDSRPTVIGNKTEAALLLLARSSWTPNDDPDARRARARFDSPSGSRLFPFSSKRKCMTVLVTKDASGPATPGRVSTRSSQKKKEWTLYHKGAAEMVLERCTRYLDIDGTERDLTDRKRSEFQKVIKDLASGALRCVALAHYKNVQDKCDPSTISAQDVERKLERDLCLDAITGIMDPLRSDVVEAVATCQRAGIIVRMVTGDNLDTAEAIARQAGILTNGKSVVGMYATPNECPM